MARAVRPVHFAAAIAVWTTVLVMATYGSRFASVVDDAPIQPDVVPGVACPPAVCSSDADCACVSSQSQGCMLALCKGGQCEQHAVPKGARCQSVPSMVCDGAGTCVFPDVPPGCFGSAPANCDAGCDDLNDCTVDHCDGGACSVSYAGAGEPCGVGAMHCWAGATCCTIDRPVCSVEGQRGECAEGSVCLGAQCWIACDPGDKGACVGLPWTACAPLSFRGVSVTICR